MDLFRIAVIPIFIDFPRVNAPYLPPLRKAVLIPSGLYLTTAMFFSGCGVSQSEYDKVKAENAALEKVRGENVALRKELEDLKFGAERISAQVEAAYAGKRFAEAKAGIKLLQEKHPESAKNEPFALLLKKIEAEELREKELAAAEAEKRKAEQARQKELAAAAEKERLRLANLNNTGVWAINSYVDQFGNKTTQRYATNRARFEGVFSNSATENSKLGVVFLVNSGRDISFKLYEYNRDNPVKSLRKDFYQVEVLDRNGRQFSMSAVNTSDRLELDLSTPSAWETFYSAMSNGGPLKFSISGGRSTYRFTIPSTEGYDNALRLLLETPK